MKVEQVMTRDVVTVTPETPLKEAALILAERRISGLPVCDETSRVVGVVSENDILFKELGPDQRRGGPLAWLLDPAPSRSPKTIARTTAEAMTSPAVTTRPKAQVSEAARVMVERGVNRLPVVKEGRLVGIVTRADLVNAFVRSDEEITARLVAVRGIGPWTAEMFLMFQLRRLDVWPTGDLGVRRGYGLAWHIPMPTARELLPLGDPFRPYRSVVAWYCWRAAELYAGAADSALTR